MSETNIKRIIEKLREVGVNRPTKPATLRRLLKSVLAVETGDASLEVALRKLGSAGPAVINTKSEARYRLVESACVFSGVGSGRRLLETLLKTGLQVA